MLRIQNSLRMLPKVRWVYWESCSDTTHGNSCSSTKPSSEVLAPHERLPEILVVPREKPPRAPQLEETPEKPPSSRGKESTCNAGGPGSIPRSGRFSGEGISYPL